MYVYIYIYICVERYIYIYICVVRRLAGAGRRCVPRGLAPVAAPCSECDDVLYVMLQYTITCYYVIYYTVICYYVIYYNICMYIYIYSDYAYTTLV